MASKWILAYSMASVSTRALSLALITGGGLGHFLGSWLISPFPSVLPLTHIFGMCKYVVLRPFHGRDLPSSKRHPRIRSFQVGDSNDRQATVGLYRGSSRMFNGLRIRFSQRAVHQKWVHIRFLLQRRHGQHKAASCDGADEN